MRVLSRIYSLPCLFIVFLALASCTDTNNIDDEPGTPPGLPPIENLHFETAGLWDSPASQFSDSAVVMAYASVNLIKHLAEGELSFPRMVIENATHAQPEYISNNKWKWEYEFQRANGSYSAEIIATVEPEFTEWKIYLTSITASTNWDNTLLYRSIAWKSPERGRWEAYYPDSDNLSSSLEWGTEAVNEKKSIRFMGLGRDLTGLVEFYKNDSMNTLVYSNFKEETSTIIRWNIITKAGRYSDTQLTEEEMICWDEDLKNTSCSPEW